MVKEGLVKKRDIERALEIQRKETKESELPLGMLLVKNGLITKNQLQRLLDQTTLSEIIRIIPHEMIKEYKSRPERL